MTDENERKLKEKKLMELKKEAALFNKDILESKEELEKIKTRIKTKKR